MLFTTFTPIFLVAISWADATLVKRVAPAREVKGACTVQDKTCQRVAVANVVGEYGVAGYFKFISPPNIEGVKVLLDVSGLGTYPGPSDQKFSYHVHTDKVGAGHNCTSTKGHLNPVNVPDTTVCDSTKPRTCQYGDLSGKHGKLSASKNATVTRSYVDTQLRFAPANYSMVGRSVVIHDAQKNRIACGNVIFEYSEFSKIH